MLRSSRKKLSVVVPAYNEAESLAAVVLQAVDSLQRLDMDFQVVIVDDGSTDRTGKIAEELAVELCKIEVVHHVRNQGLGAAIVTGYRYATGDFVTQLHADGQISPETLHAFFPLMYGVDVISTIYTRRPDHPFRLLMSRALRLITRLMVGSYPRLQGIYMFRRELLNAFPLVCTTGMVNLEFLIRAQQAGYRIAEIAINCNPRLRGKSKVANLRTILKMFNEGWELRQVLGRDKMATLPQQRG